MNAFRVKSWEQFIGQSQVVKSLNIAIQAAKKRAAPVEHILLFGPPGLGKTTIAHLIATSQGGNIKTITGPTLTRVGDLAALLTNLEPSDVLFIDEIHRLHHTVEEALYPAMEDFFLDIIVGKGPAARALRLDLNQFTLIGATTRIGNLSKPLRDRFGLTHRLGYYNSKELTQIILQAAKKMKVKISLKSVQTIAARARGTPRIAIKLLRRVVDYCLIEHQTTPNMDLTLKALNFYQVDSSGLDETDRKLLTTIINQYNGGPVGLETLAALISEDVKTVEEVYEPFLIQTGFLTRTHSGRVTTPKAVKHLKS